MSTPRDLMNSTFQRWKDLAMLNGTLEDYVLFTFAKLASFAIGVATGYWIWEM
tara:strand:+ start:245 stop:403 length:159 start_codon:yes stop_codon:yes gene_type:complete